MSKYYSSSILFRTCFCILIFCFIPHLASANEGLTEQLGSQSQMDFRDWMKKIEKELKNKNSEGSSNFLPENNSNSTEISKNSLKATNYEYLNLQLDAYLSARQFDDQYLKSTSAITLLSPKVNIHYNQNLSLNFATSGEFVTGNTTNFFTEEGKKSDSFYLDEAAVQYQTNNSMYRVGALKVVLNPIQSVMSPNTFLSAQQNYQFDLGSTLSRIAWILTEAIPSSGSVSKEIIEDSTQASFWSQSLVLHQDLNWSRDQLDAAISYYQFSNLSSNVASDSVLIGNSPGNFTGLSRHCFYLIDFRGIEAAASYSKYWTPNFQSRVKYSFIQNLAIEGPSSSGMIAHLELIFKNGNYALSPQIKLFDVGADVTPAAYSNILNRFHNRTGYSLILNLEMHKEQLNFFGAYTQANTIEFNPYMSDRDYFYLGMRAHYDIL